MRPVALRTEGEARPLGLGVAAPRLSWRLEATPGRRRERQEAYQVQVAGQVGDWDVPLWDTGRVVSSAQAVTYAGAPLRSRGRYRWRARTWDAPAQASPWSEPALFEMALLEPSEWHASWIGGAPSAAPGQAPDLVGLSRIWLPGRLGDHEQALFRHRFALGPNGPAAARLWAAGGAVEAWLNGSAIGRCDPGGLVEADVAPHLRPGENVLALRARQDGTPARGMIAALAVTPAQGQIVRTGTGDDWLCAPASGDGWESDVHDDSGWALAEAVARYGEPPWGREPLAARPCTTLRRSFQVDGPVARARIHASALGVYELRLNGGRVSGDCLAPGWTDYRRRVRYQTHDVTDRVRPGENVVGAILGDGWYAGHVASRGPAQYGRDPLFTCQVELVLEDGRRQVIVTDETWQASSGEVRYADLIMGQTIDNRRSQPGWDLPGFDAERWEPARVADERPHLVPDAGPPARVALELHPVGTAEPAPGTLVLDMGQNMAGWVRLRARGPRGRKIVVRHGEALEAEGSLYTTNLRSAQATDELILAGEGEDEVFAPRFTYHGFRYVELTGYPGRPGPGDVVGHVVHADMEVTGGFECSHEGLNQLQHNIVWGQRGNFLSVPTDCPQRDERMGWTGDAQVFCATAIFNMDARRFLARWLLDVVGAQHESGAIPDVVPVVARTGAGAAGWGDAVAVVPWTLYQLCGDLRIVETCFPAIERWLDYLVGSSDGLARPATGYGDWLSVDAETPKDLAGTAYFAYSARLTAELAAALGRGAEAARYRTLFESVRQAFRRRFVRGGARIAGGTQTAYVLALHVGLLDEDERPLAAERLVADIRSRHWHLSTGFLGTPWLLPVLAGAGHLDVAYRLLLQDTFPSWLAQVRQGATTMWERWDSHTEAKGFHTSSTTEGVRTPEMNSLNHYAYGSVGAFLYEWLGGISCARPGYEEVLIRPRPAPGVTWARSWFDSVRGRIDCSWRLEGSQLHLDVEVPPGVVARVSLPSAPERAEEGGLPLRRASDLSVLSASNEETVVRTGSGRYRFAVREPALAVPFPADES